MKPAEITIEDNIQSERTLNLTKVIVTEVTEDLRFYAQRIENGKYIFTVTHSLSTFISLVLSLFSSSSVVLLIRSKA